MKKNIKMLFAFVIMSLFLIPVMNVNASCSDPGSFDEAMQCVFDDTISYPATQNPYSIVSEYSGSNAHVNVPIPKDYSKFSFGKVNNPSSIVYTIANSADTVAHAKAAWTSSHGSTSTFKSVFERDEVEPIVLSKPGIQKDPDDVTYTACFPKFGLYEGEYVDVKAELTHYKLSSKVSDDSDYPKYAVLAFSYHATKKYPSVAVMGVDYARVKWTFHEHNESGSPCSGALKTVKGNTTYRDIDSQQSVGKYISNPTDNSRKGLYVNSNSNVLMYSKIAWTNGNPATEKKAEVVYEGYWQDSTAGDEKYSFTEIFETNTLQRFYSFHDDNQSSVGGIAHQPTPITKQEEDNPIKKVNKPYVMENTTFIYELSQFVPQQYTTYHYSSFEMQDILDNALYVGNDASVKVICVDDNNQDVTAKYFTITRTGQTVKAAFAENKKINGKIADEDFYGKTYKLVITTHVKPGYVFSGNNVIPNNGTVKFDNVTKTSNTVNVEVLRPTKTYGTNTNYVTDNREVKPNNNISYKITLPNVETTQQTVVVTDTFSKGLIYNNDINCGSGVNVAAGDTTSNEDTGSTTYRWNVSLPAGTSTAATTVVCNYSAKVTTDAVNTVNNHANASYTNGGTYYLGELINPVPRKSYSDAEPTELNGKLVQNGDRIQYRISYANIYDNVNKVTVRDVLSEGLTYVKGSAKLIGLDGKEVSGVTLTETVDETGRNITWERAGIAKGTIESIVYDVEVTGEGNKIVVNNQAYVTFGDRPEVQIDHLTNPLPKKEYSEDTPSGYNGAAVTKGNKIKYQIRYKNIYDQAITATIKDTLSEGLTYVKGSSKIGNEKIADPKIEGQKLTWSRDLESNAEEILTYEVLVTGTSKPTVNNKASIIYSNNPEVEKYLNQLINPIPRKDYAAKTAGKGGATVKKNDVISYSIKYSNIKDEKATVIITDNLSKGLEYQKGAKINGKAVEPDSVTKDTNGTMLVWIVEAEKNTAYELVYSAKVTGEKMIVENNASIQFETDPLIHLDILRNPLVLDPTTIKVPDTASTIEIAAIAGGIALIGAGGFILYRKYKKA